MGIDCGRVASLRHVEGISRWALRSILRLLIFLATVCLKWGHRFGGDIPLGIRYTVCTYGRSTAEVRVRFLKGKVIPSIQGITIR